jgi:hypothetical protein
VLLLGEEQCWTVARVPRAVVFGESSQLAFRSGGMMLAV